MAPVHSTCSARSAMAFDGSYPRQVREHGAVHRIYIRQVRCGRCGTGEALLPDFTQRRRLDSTAAVGAAVLARHGRSEVEGPLRRRPCPHGSFLASAVVRAGGRLHDPLRGATGPVGRGRHPPPRADTGGGHHHVERLAVAGGPPTADQRCAPTVAACQPSSAVSSSGPAWIRRGQSSRTGSVAQGP